MKKWLIILAVLLTPLTFGLIQTKVSSKRFDEEAVLGLVKQYADATKQQCTLKEKSYIPIRPCSREDQISYLFECTNGSLTVCCGLMKDCSVRFK